MSHYICRGGCGGVADQPGACQEEVCDNWGEPLEVCECVDGQHEVREEEIIKNEEVEE